MLYDFHTSPTPQTAQALGVTPARALRRVFARRMQESQQYVARGLSWSVPHSGQVTAWNLAA